MSSGSSSPSASAPPTERPAEPPKVKRFMNGWSKEQDALMADWSDIAGCYRWLHDKAEKQYTSKNMRMTIPVIILSTLTGTASVGISSLANGDEQIQKYMNFGIGGVSLIAAILTTLNNFLRYAQLGESNRVAGVSWGKFQRLIAVELALNPNERMDSLDFLKICRAELDRLIEQSPAIPDDIIAAFETEFKDNKKLRRPDICHGLDHTRVFDSSQSRLKNMTADAALMLLQKKRALKQEIIPELDRMIASAVASTAEATKKELEEKLAAVAVPVLLPKPSASSLFKASEVDFATVLEQRRAAVLRAAKPASRMPTDDIYIDFSKTSPAASAAFAPAAPAVDELIPEAIVIAEPEEEKK